MSFDPSTHCAPALARGTCSGFRPTGIPTGLHIFAFATLYSMTIHVEDVTGNKRLNMYYSLRIWQLDLATEIRL
jgi:hypothetical protein